MKIRVVANRPISCECPDITEHIGQIFEVAYMFEDVTYVRMPDDRVLGLFAGEYEAVE